MHHRTCPHTLITTVVTILLPLAGADGAIRTETVTYQDGDTQLQGTLCYDDAVTDRRPGVLVLHEWWGLNDYAQRRAQALAEMGYVAFAADMYGDGRVTKHPSEASTWSSTVTKNLEGWRRRALA